jgi:FtsP/CotA-like multicopper oxidase with cupredoxin domain
MDIKLALPGHRFTVIALDGNPVPTRTTVDVLALDVAERADVIVEMNLRREAMSAIYLRSATFEVEAHCR